MWLQESLSWIVFVRGWFGKKLVFNRCCHPHLERNDLSLLSLILLGFECTHVLSCPCSPTFHLHLSYNLLCQFPIKSFEVLLCSGTACQLFALLSLHVLICAEQGLCCFSFHFILLPNCFSFSSKVWIVLLCAANDEKKLNTAAEDVNFLQAFCSSLSSGDHCQKKASLESSFPTQSVECGYALSCRSFILLTLFLGNLWHTPIDCSP